MSADWLLAGLLGASLVRSLASYGRSPAEGRLAMAVVRTAAVGLLVAVLVAPSWVRVRVERLRPRITVLVDRSRSMDLPLEGEVEGVTRYQAAKRAAGMLVAGYQGAFELEIRSFATGLEDPLEGSGEGLPETAAGEGTDLSGALTQALGGATERTRAIFLVSDGRSTRGGSPVPVARSSRIPIHTLGAGRPRNPGRDLAVLSVDAPEEAFVGGGVAVTARIRARGEQPGTQIPVELRVDGELVRTHAATVPAEGDEVEVVIPWVPGAGGFQELEVAVSGGAGDATPGDDRALTAVSVADQATPVLVLSVRPSPDLGFVRRLLAADPRYRLVERSGFGTTRTLALPPAGSEGALDRAALVVLGGYSRESLPGAVAEALAGYVRDRGGALLVVGCGPREIRDLLEGPLGAVMPFEMPVETAPLERRLPAEPVAGHPLTRVLEHPQANLQAWQRLPPIAPALALQAVGGAKVVVAAPYYPRPLPLVAMRNVRRGVTVAVNGSETYLWAMLPQAHGDPERVFERFFSGVLGFAADPARAGGEKLAVGRARVRPGERVRVVWRGPEGATGPRAARMVPWRSGPPAASATLEARDPGVVEGEITAPGPGLYRVVTGSGVGGPEARLAVLPSREEAMLPEPDPSVLRAVAEASGGAFLSVKPEGIGKDQLPRVDASPVIRRHSAGTYLQDEPWVLAAALLLLCLEWWLRRRQNLV